MKAVSKKFYELMEEPIVQVILDRTTNLDEAIEEVRSWWSYDLFNRKPGPAYTEDGVFKGTDLDMACFLYELAERGAAINLTGEYKSFRQTKFKEGEMLTSKENRHGILKGLVSNKEFFTFSISVEDQNVMTTDGTGEDRTFSLTDFKGNWYPGWKEIQFLSTAKENQWLHEHNIISGENKIVFKHFIHPNRWTSFYGVKYFITKLLLQRMTEEASHYYKNIKAMEKEGITFPPSDGYKPKKSFTDKSVDGGKQINVDAFEVEVDYPDNDTEFPEIEFNSENYAKYYRRRNNYIFGVGRKLRFMTRATEFAHYKNPDRFPHWIKGAEWNHEYKQKGGKKVWSRLVLCQPENFKLGLALRKRSWSKSTRVSENYEYAE